MKDFGSRADVERALTELGRQMGARARAWVEASMKSS